LSCLAVQLSLFFSYFSVPHRVLPSFPTRRSSDLEDLLQLGEDDRHQRFQRRTGIASLDARLLRNVLWRADAGHDILTLRVDEELAVDLFDTRRGIAREGNTGRGVVTHVAEYHRLHGDGRAPRVGNLVQAPVGDGASVLPGAEHCL